MKSAPDLMSLVIGSAAIMVFLLAGTDMSYAQFVDPLNVPAVAVLRPDHAPLLAVAHAGDDLVAVGSRGVIIVSTMKSGVGSSWVQSTVPVQSDLVAVQFVDATEGWACGFDGVILHTIDGGKHWSKNLDGWSAKAAFESYYSQQVTVGNPVASAGLREVHLNFGKGPVLPWLGIWFDTALNGYVVGPFGDIAATTDGGKHWIPWFDHIDNANYYNLNAINEIAGNIYIVGEQGLVFKLDRLQHKFLHLSTGYAGSFFGITGTKDFLVVYGLRGTIYRSADQGNTWSAVNDPNGAAISNGEVLPNGEIVLVTVNGKILVSGDEGRTFRVESDSPNSELSDVTFYRSDTILATGSEGIVYAAVK